MGLIAGAGAQGGHAGVHEEPERDVAVGAHLSLDVQHIPQPEPQEIPLRAPVLWKTQQEKRWEMGNPEKSRSELQSSGKSNGIIPKATLKRGKGGNGVEKGMGKGMERDGKSRSRTVHEAQGEQELLLRCQRRVEGRPGGTDGATGDIIPPGKGNGTWEWE